MKTELAICLTIVVSIMLAINACILHQVKTSFTLDNNLYEQAGVMEMHDSGNTLYVPVFRRKNI
jgi:hypothetical protein